MSTLPKGFSIRPATMDDVEDVTGLVNACHIEQTGKPRVEAHEIRSDWGAPGFDVTNDTIDNDPDYDPSLWFVAVQGEEIVGMSLCRPKTAEDPEMSWIDLVAVRRPWRRRGVALALLRHSFGEFYRRGKRKVGLGVDAQSLTGATRLYEKAGMRVERQYVQYEQELRAGEDLSTQSVED